jgi:hypothetical protein
MSQRHAYVSHDHHAAVRVPGGAPGGRRGPAPGLGRYRTASSWRDRGTATAEYAIATLAACGFAGLLLTLLRSDQVRGMLTSVIHRALTLG